MTKETTSFRVPFDYDKYDADRSAWKLYSRDKDEIVALFKSDDPDDGKYVLKGVVRFSSSKRYHEMTWTLKGTYVESEEFSYKDIVWMEPVEVKKSITPAVKLHIPMKLRNLYYDRLENHLTMSITNYSDYASAEKVALNETTLHPEKNTFAYFQWRIILRSERY